MDLTKAYNPIVAAPHPTAMGGETRMFEGGGRRKSRRNKSRRNKSRRNKSRRNKSSRNRRR